MARTWTEVVTVTGFGMEADRRRSAELGIDLHLVKPVDPEQLQTLLRRFQGIIAVDGQAPATRMQLGTEGFEPPTPSV